MHITSGLSPASGEMLDTSVLNLYGDAGEPYGTFFAVDHTVPESSHTVEIEYVYETEEIHTETRIEPDQNIKNVTKTETQKPKEKIKNDPPRSLPNISKNVALDNGDLDTDLTNLNWLQNITNIMSIPQFSIRPVSPVPASKTAPQNTRLDKFNHTIDKCQKDYLENREEYRNNDNKKPPYSYSTLICLAMKNNNNKMTLAAIYSWIRENFKFFRTSDITWQNSIRHNLSLNKVFVKIARSKHEPGKGGFWKLDLAHLEGAKRISNRPIKKKKSLDSKMPDATVSEDKTAVANIPRPETMDVSETISEMEQAVTLHLPEFNLSAISTTELVLENTVGANVIVEPNVPPPLIPEDDLSTLLLNPTDWDDLQLDMLDNYLDTCFK